MLPFLKPKQSGTATGIIIKNRTPDEKPEENQDDKDAGLKACIRELIDSVHSRDAQGALEALRSAFEIMDSQPHEEYDHDKASPHTYQAQNQKAGE